LNDKGFNALTLVHFNEHNKDQEWYYDGGSALRNSAHPNLLVDVRAGGIFNDIVLAPKNDTN
jgi:hypothetical protein